MGAGEMAQGSRVLAALAGDLGPLPAPTWQLTAICNSSPRDPWAWHTLSGRFRWYIDIHAGKTPRLKKKASRVGNLNL